MRFKSNFIKILVIKRPKYRRETTESPYKRNLHADEVNHEAKGCFSNKSETSLSVGLHVDLAEWALHRHNGTVSH